MSRRRDSREFAPSVVDLEGRVSAADLAVFGGIAVIAVVDDPAPAPVPAPPGPIPPDPWLPLPSPVPPSGPGAIVLVE